MPFQKGHKFAKGGSKRKVRPYRNGQTRLMEPPNSYQANFLTKMDFRTEVYHNMDSEYRQILGDLGGKENLSVLELGLVERFVFCSYLIRDCEIKLAQSANGKQAKYLERWIKLNHSIQSIVAKLGIQIRKPQSNELKAYVEERDEV